MFRAFSSWGMPTTMVSPSTATAAPNRSFSLTPRVLPRVSFSTNCNSLVSMVAPENASICSAISVKTCARTCVRVSNTQNANATHPEAPKRAGTTMCALNWILGGTNLL